MTDFNIHDNIFIAAGRQLGYVLTQDDVIEIRNRHKFSITCNTEIANSEIMQIVVSAVRQYINSCVANNQPIKRISVK